MTKTDEKKLVNYLPLILVISFILLVILGWEIFQGRFDLRESLRLFMGLFFLIFSFFKFLDWKGFAYAYAGYDIIAKHFLIYAYIYPIIEMILGFFFILNIFPIFTNIITIIVMSISSIGVIQTVLGKRKIHCACLGAVIKLPMTTVTIIEDVGMGLMALVMLVWIFL